MFPWKCSIAQYHQTICAVKSQSRKFYIIYISHNPFTAWNASLVACLHGWAIVCALTQNFAQSIIFLRGNTADNFIADRGRNKWSIALSRVYRTWIQAALGMDQRSFQYSKKYPLHGEPIISPLSWKVTPPTCQQLDHDHHSLQYTLSVSGWALRLLRSQCGQSRFSAPASPERSASVLRFPLSCSGSLDMLPVWDICCAK